MAEIVMAWAKLTLKCAVSHEALMDPATTPNCSHPPRCNYASLKQYKRCPILHCNAQCDRQRCIQKDEELAGLIGPLIRDRGLEEVWMRRVDDRWEVREEPPDAPSASAESVDLLGAVTMTPRQIIKQECLEDGQLLEKALSVYSPKVDPLLLLAACNGHSRYCSILLDKGANPDYKSEMGTPLVLAAHNNHVQVAAVLLKAEAQLNITSRDGDTPLHRACAQDGCTPEMVGKLIENGADLEVRDRTGCTALIRAVKNDLVRPDLIRLLVERGANLLAVDQNGIGVVHWLLELKSDPKSPADEEQANRNREVLEIIVRAEPRTARLKCGAGGTPLDWLMLFVPGCGDPEHQWGHYERQEDVEKLAQALIAHGGVDPSSESRMYAGGSELMRCACINGPQWQVHR